MYIGIKNDIAYTADSISDVVTQMGINVTIDDKKYIYVNLVKHSISYGDSYTKREALLDFTRNRLIKYIREVYSINIYKAELA